jgi:hypothetical protein
MDVEGSATDGALGSVVAGVGNSAGEPAGGLLRITADEPKYAICVGPHIAYTGKSIAVARDGASTTEPVVLSGDAAPLPGDAARSA